MLHLVLTAILSAMLTIGILLWNIIQFERSFQKPAYDWTGRAQYLRWCLVEAHKSIKRPVKRVAEWTLIILAIFVGIYSLFISLYHVFSTFITP